MRKRLQESEAELFRASVEDVEPIETDQAEPFRHRPPPVPIAQPRALSRKAERATLSEAEVETGDYLLFTRPGVQKRLLADLQRGQMEVELELDLHGLTATYAEHVLEEFLRDCAFRHVRCALIVHGKGYRSGERQPVLKRKINYWLRLYDQVLAFCSATRRDGGTGAVYLLLRNPEKSRRERRGV
ncbi:MAG: Smr/MutS family protein [Chromatiaceae bacterium]|jgi:DNA-nicking Smr family endonuclease|nr:Smr/MutS family protein [Chromatiaceae bacterium]